MKQPRTQRLIIRVDSGLIRRLDAHARRYNATRSEIARRAITFGLENGAKAQKPQPAEKVGLFD